MVSMYCWPSVSIKRGARLIIGRKVIKPEFEWIFGYLLISIDGFFEQASYTCHHFIKWFLKDYFNFYFAYLPTLCVATFCPRNIRFS